MKKKLWALVLAGILTLVPLTTSANAQNKEEKEMDKAGYVNHITTTEKHPFLKGAGNSEKFRIPAFISLHDGTLFAAADARYETTGDGGGLDTIVAKSDNFGETWQQSYAIQYPDSKGFADLISTTCIDPCIVEGDDGKIYVLADMNPTGVTTKPEYISPNVGTGYIKIDGVDRLALTDDYEMVNKNPKETSYPYYLGDFVDGYAKVLSTNDHSETNWALDAWWNIYEINDGGKYAPLYQKQVDSDTKIYQNAFYKDSVLHVYNTGYLLMAESSDKGETWTPKVLNTQIKREHETALLVSPGKGTLASDGTILIPFYTFDRTEDKIIQQASFIYSKDNGATWQRSTDAPNGNGVEWSSESEIVEVYDGVLRMFIRNGTGKISYIDAKWDESVNDYIWNTPVVTDVKVWSNCNITASTYSKEIDGKKAIFIACPSGKKRTAGKVFTFLVNEDNSMTPTYAYRVNRGDYAYSCMDELQDGRMGLLYEAKPGTMQYQNIAVDALIKHEIGYETKVNITASVVGGVVLLGAVAACIIKVCKHRKTDIK